jgi:PAS domain S-box-containing protein
MLKPKIPEDDDLRIEALEALAILDTTPDEQLDFITKIVRERFDVPIALISLVDKNRQWFKSKQGLTATETPRDISFCGHAILHPEIFEVSNAIEDARFKDNPLVMGPPHIRFYAGQPLTITGEFRIGTLCIIDSKPRKLSQDEKAELKGFAKLIQDHLNTKDLASHAERLLDHARHGLFEIDTEYKLIYVNTFGANTLGYTKEELLESKLDLILPKKRYDGSRYRLEQFGGFQTFQSKVIHQSDEDLLQKDGKIIHASCHFEPVFRLGKVVSILMSFRDNFERDSLVAELHWQRENLDKIISTQIAALNLYEVNQKPEIK